jgi:hypothetical protein
MQSTAEDTRPIESEGETTIRRLLDAEWLTALEAAPYAGNIGVSIIREACNRNELTHVRIGVSVATIRKACSRHDLRHIRIGRANGRLGLGPNGSTPG